MRSRVEKWIEETKTEEEVVDEELEDEQDDKELFNEGNDNNGSRNDIGSQKSFFDTIDEK